MAKDVKLQIDSGVLADILASGEVGKECEKAARGVAETARQIGGGFQETGEYVASIHVEPGYTSSGRAAAYVVADTTHAAWIESKYGVLKKALNARKVG